VVSAIVDAFLAALPPGDTTGDDITAPLEAAVARGAAARPDLAVAAEDVAAHLGRHADDERPAAIWLATRNLGDIHLAIAAARGIPAAVAVFEREIVPDLHAAARRVLGDDARADDIVAAVRERLLVGGDERGPRILEYGGHGELRIWARVITVRAAVDELRRQKREVPADDALWDAASPSVDPALAAQKRQSAALVKQAFHAALAVLTPRQRNLLRQHLLDGLTIDDLAPMYRIHRVTAARWLAAARTDLWAATRRELRAKLALDDSAIAAMLDDIRSTLDLSIERAFGSP
jgi:RNA polymerase sigma-70 factor (ECF subfamily)